MILLNRKKKVTVQNFCQDYYDAHILFFKESGEYLVSPAGASAVFWRVALDTLKASSPAYSFVEEKNLENEMIALRFELFALAWGHESHQDSLTVAQCVFTHNYLIHCGREQIWKTMGEYNQVVARSGYFQALERSGYSKSKNETVRKQSHFHVNKARADWFDRQVMNEVDQVCIGRVANRIGTSAHWQKSTGLAIVASSVVERLGCELESGARDHLMFFIRMLYEGSLQAVRIVKFVPE